MTNRASLPYHDEVYHYRHAKRQRSEETDELQEFLMRLNHLDDKTAENIRVNLKEAASAPQFSQFEENFYRVFKRIVETETKRRQ